MGLLSIVLALRNDFALQHSAAILNREVGNGDYTEPCHLKSQQ